MVMVFRLALVQLETLRAAQAISNKAVQVLLASVAWVARVAPAVLAVLVVQVPSSSPVTFILLLLDLQDNGVVAARRLRASMACRILLPQAGSPQVRAFLLVLLAHGTTLDILVLMDLLADLVSSKAAEMVRSRTTSNRVLLVTRVDQAGLVGLRWSCPPRAQVKQQLRHPRLRSSRSRRWQK